MTFEELPFHINPSTRIGSPYLQVKWQKVDQPILQAEACFVSPNQTAYTVRKTATAICCTDSDTLYICYSDATDFERVHFQHWLRRQIKQFILAMAEHHLPLRFHQIESHKGLKASGVSVRKLRTNVLGQCDNRNHITLSPILVLMPQRMSDCVMMHEMAHIKHKHHRQSFWKYLSELLGENATAEKYRSDIAITQKNAMIQYLMK